MRAACPRPQLLGGSSSFENSVDGGASDGEYLHQFGDGVVASGVHAYQLGLLPGGQLGSTSFELAARACDGHALAGAHLQQVGLELGEHREHVEEHLRHRVRWVVDAAAQRQPHAAGYESVADGPGVGNGSGEPVEFRNNEGVAGADGGQGLVEAGAGPVGAEAGPVGAGESLVEVDPVVGDAKGSEDLALGGEILEDGRAVIEGLVRLDGQ